MPDPADYRDGESEEEPSVMSAHLTPVMTSRGFQHLPRTVGRRDRGWVQVYESSNAEEACIWLQAIDDKGVEATIQFNLTAAQRLAEQIGWLCENHYQNEDDDREDRA